MHMYNCLGVRSTCILVVLHVGAAVFHEDNYQIQRAHCPLRSSQLLSFVSVTMHLTISSTRGTGAETGTGAGTGGQGQGQGQGQGERDINRDWGTWTGGRRQGQEEGQKDRDR